MESPFTFALAVIAMVLLFRLIKPYVNQNTERERAAPLTEERDGLLERLKKLEQRIEVLERIVTDRRHELNRQFEELDS